MRREEGGELWRQAGRAAVLRLQPVWSASFARVYEPGAETDRRAIEETAGLSADGGISRRRTEHEESPATKLENRQVQKRILLSNNVIRFADVPVGPRAKNEKQMLPRDGRAVDCNSLKNCRRRKSTGVRIPLRQTKIGTAQLVSRASAYVLRPRLLGTGWRCEVLQRDYPGR